MLIRKLESAFEGLIWRSRLVVIAAVVASLVAALAMFYMATVDAWFMVVHLLDYASPALPDAQRAVLWDLGAIADSFRRTRGQARSGRRRRV